MSENYPDFSDSSDEELFEKARRGSDREKASASVEIDRRRFNRWSELQVNTKNFLDAAFRNYKNAADQISKEQHDAAKRLVTATKWIAVATVALVIMALLQFGLAVMPYVIDP